MRAVKCEAFGDPNTLSVGEMDQPKPGSGEVLVEVKAAAVSFMALGSPIPARQSP